MFVFERIAVAYFLLLAAVAMTTGATRHRSMRALGTAALLVIVIVAASRTLPEDLRAWLPHLYLVAGYWLPSMLVPAPGQTRFETWLRRHDEGWRRYVGTLSAGSQVVLELSYLACYVLVPLAFVIVWSRGSPQQVERFWVAVLIAGYACYAPLPWLVSRPPRWFVESPASPTRIASFNLLVLRAASHQLNTFPSGHVAVATAAALGVLSVWPLAGTILGVAAAGIAAGAAIGRYHYGIDVIVGAIVGIVTAAATL